MVLSESKEALFGAYMQTMCPLAACYMKALSPFSVLQEISKTSFTFPHVFADYFAVLQELTLGTELCQV